MCPSICPCLSTWLPLDDFFVQFDIWVFTEKLLGNSKFFKCKITTLQKYASLQSSGGQNIKESQLCWSPKWMWVVGLTSCPLFFRERAPITHWIEGWVGPRPDLDILENRKISCFGLSTPQPSHYNDYAMAPESRNSHPDYLHMKMLPFFYKKLGEWTKFNKTAFNMVIIPLI
jgi:hypothetical protein